MSHHAPYGLAGWEALYVRLSAIYNAHPHRTLGPTASDHGMRAEIDRMTDKVQPGQLQHHQPVLERAEWEWQLLRPLAAVIFGDNGGLYTQGHGGRRYLADRASSEVIRDSLPRQRH